LWQIAHLAGKPFIRLSGGEKRLALLAVAMAGKPPVLLLDEPTNNLDPQRRNQVWQNLRQLNRERGTTILFITHDAIEAEKIIQRVGIMRQGKLVATGAPSELKSAVDQLLRLEIFYHPDSPPDLPQPLERYILDAGRCLVYLPRNEAGNLINHLDMQHIHDFRLYSATLEDLYLYYANRV